MKNRKKIKNFSLLQKVASIASILIVGLVSTMLLGAPTNQAHALDQTWGPQDRERFTWERPATFPTFNSMTNNPFIGDESNFVRVKEYIEGEEGNHVDNVTVEPGKEYEVWIYFHNNAGTSYNSSGQGLADNTRIATSFPSKLTAGDSGVIRGSVSATNATPTAVWDTAFFNANETVYLSYVPNTAILHYSDYVDGDGNTQQHNCASANGTLLGQAIFADSGEVGNSTTAGAKITCFNSDRAWGIIPGCNEYAGYVTYRVKVDQPRFWVEKTVSPAGTDTWTETITANPGDELDFKIYYVNTGTTKQTNVNVHDVLPEKISLVPDTMKIVAPRAPDGLELNAENQAKLFSDTGMNIDNYDPGQSATITYRVKLDDDLDAYTCGENVFYNNVAIETENGAEYDKVKIVVNKNCGGSPEPTCATNPELPGCQEIVQTGPVEITLAVVILLGIGGTVFYLVRTRRKLAIVEGKINGKSDQKAKKMNEMKEPEVPKSVKNDKETKN